MAYRADITQALTPSAPDISGAVGAIQSQAAIAQTLFGGISQGVEMYKQTVQQQALKEAEAEQKRALVESETKIEAEEQAASELLSAQQRLEQYQGTLFGPNKPTAISPVSEEPAYKADVAAAAAKLALARSEGGITQSEYFLRVANLVDKYSAMFPGSRADVRKAVEQGSGLPGADLWASQQFIRRLFTPQEAKAESDKLEQKAIDEEFSIVVNNTPNVPPTELLAIQRTNPELWNQIRKNALEIRAMSQNADALNKQTALNVAASDPEFLQKSDLLARSATLAAGIATSKYLSQEFPRFDNIRKKLENNTFNEQDQAEAQVLFNGMKGAVQAAFARNRIEVQNAAGPNVSSAALSEMMRRLKDREDATLALLDTSTQAQTVAAMKMFAEAKNKSIENRVKLTGAWAQLVGAVGDQNLVRTALATGETDENGKTTPIWQQISKQAPPLIPLLREFQLLIEDSPAQLTRNVIRSSVLSRGLEDAASSPEPTNLPNATPQQRSGVAQGVALWGAEIVARSRESKLEAAKAMQIGESFANDANVVGTALSNATLGHGLNIINQNKEQFKDFISKLPEDKKSAVSFSASKSYAKSLESAKRGLNLISDDPKYRLKQPLKLGVRPDGVIGIIPPPKEFLTESPRESRLSYVPLPANIRKYYKEGSMFKPEFLEEGEKWAMAMEEWENKYLPRVAGAITTRAIIENTDSNKVAQDVVRTIQNNKPIEGFYKMENIPQQVAAETPVKSTINVEGFGEIKNPSLEKLLSLAQLPTTPDDTRKKLVLIVEDMMRGQQGQ